MFLSLLNMTRFLHISFSPANRLQHHASQGKFFPGGDAPTPDRVPIVSTSTFCCFWCQTIMTVLAFVCAIYLDESSIFVLHVQQSLNLP